MSEQSEWVKLSVSDELLRGGSWMIEQQDMEHNHSAKGRATAWSSTPGAAWASEWIVAAWLTDNDIDFRRDPTGTGPDLVFPGKNLTMDVKNKASDKIFRETWHVGVPEDSSLERDSYIFTGYQSDPRCLYIFGVASAARVRRISEFVPKGGQLTNGSPVLVERDFWDVPILGLATPDELLKYLSP